MKMTAAASHLDKEVLETAKFGSLSMACTNLCLFATKNEQSYMIALDKIQQLTLRIEQMVADDESAKRARNCVLQAGMKLKDSVTVNIKVALKSLNMMGLKLANAPRHCSYNVLTPPVSMESGSPSSPTFTFETTCPWRHDISEGIDGHYDSSNTIGITYETDASIYYNWWPHNNL
ncbi:hypothetical protein CUMW_279170 [Citrus unshiu]|uniref:Uncharacterized protein n=1 Tax=Citrus unshiu TaxID=55188 RepID=A0A2H5N961_CITUN|nr:hypothetical protein CUMW_279170 [Citrus unshiu]